MPTKKLLVVDTNILSHALTPNQTEAYEALFVELEQTYKFVVTGFTRFELLRSSDKDNQAKITKYLQSDMVNIDLSTTLMDFSARVNNLYAKHPSTKGHKITEGDIINASLAIIKDCPIITIDSLDYPTPFFQEIDRKRVEYKSVRGRDVIDTVYILKPDMDNLRHCFGEHEV